MSSEVAVAASELGKAYLIYRQPEDRLKQMIFRRRKYYEEYWAFQNINLSIRRGETVGIVGRNGSGKSTLLQVIAGTLRPTTGNIEVHGRVAPLLELGAGFNPEFTGAENVRLAGAVLGLPDEKIRARFQDIVDFAGIGEFIGQPVKTYSSGMYARLAFAVAAHVEADILIVDEILSVGDAAFAQKCMRYIHEFKANGTLLFVSHSTEAVNALCERAIWMDKGQVRADGPAKEVGFAYHASLREELDGQGFSLAGRRRQSRPANVHRDFRHETLKASDKRNVLELFTFDRDAPSMGLRGGEIVNVRFLDRSGAELPALEGGEEVVLRIECLARKDIARPIVGFFIKDRLGQNLFGDNTYLTYADNPVPLEAGGRLIADFAFQLPYLPSGDYSVNPAFAEGTQAEHVQHHWIEDALTFHCTSSYVVQGLVGIPMHSIDLSRR